FPTAAFGHETFRVCFVGLFEPWKGLHYLIDGFNQASLTDAELVLWGAPGARPIAKYLATAISGNPAIRIEPAEVRRIGYENVYAKSSVFVQPSLSDGFGYTVAEAMASGIPVIVTETTGAAEMVSDGENGYVIPSRDSGAIAERLRYLAVNPGLVRRMGE